MIQIPDINPYLKGGVIGILFFMLVGCILIIGWLLKNNFVSPSKPTGGASGPPRELTAGEKSTDYWEKIFADIETEGNHALLEVLSEQHRATMEQLGKLRARLRDTDNAAALNELRGFRAKYDQDMIAIAKMLRAIEEKVER